AEELLALRKSWEHSIAENMGSPTRGLWNQTEPPAIESWLDSYRFDCRMRRHSAQLRCTPSVSWRSPPQVRACNAGADCFANARRRVARVRPCCGGAGVRQRDKPDVLPVQERRPVRDDGGTGH